MKFRTKLILGFTIVVFLISSVLGIVSYSYNSRRLSDKAKQSLEFYSGQLTSAVDVTVDSMKHLTDYILSDADMLFAMQSMPKLHALGNDIERKKQTDILVDGLATDYVLRNFYRVIVFNEMGDVISSTNAGSKITNKKRNISKIPWLSEAADMHGKPILIGPHEDGWSLQGKRAKVFSLARKVQGGDFGYIEVQMDMEKMDASFRLADESVMVAAWIPDGSLLYCSDNFTDSELLKTLQKRGGG